MKFWAKMGLFWYMVVVAAVRVFSHSSAIAGTPAHDLNLGGKGQRAERIQSGDSKVASHNEFEPLAWVYTARQPEDQPAVAKVELLALD